MTRIPAAIRPFSTTRRLLPLIFLGALLSLGCERADPRALEGTAYRWFVSVQQRDYSSLAEVDASAPAEREGDAFDEWTDELELALGQYELQRDYGEFTLDSRGYALVQASGLGRGTFFEVVESGGLGGEPYLVLQLNLGYADINYSPHPPGTTVYLLGFPLGKIYPVKLGAYKSHEMEVLDHVFVRVEFERMAKGQSEDARYKVRALSWDDRSPVHRSVNWVF